MFDLFLKTKEIIEIATLSVENQRLKYELDTERYKYTGDTQNLKYEIEKLKYEINILKKNKC